MKDLPLTVNGKVDRKALPAPEGEEGEGREYVEPRNETEKALSEVWAEVLKRERVGVRDNFFSLGGDSILSIRIVSLLKSRGVVVGIKEIFQYQTIEELAEHVEREREKEEEGGRRRVEEEVKIEAYGLLTEEERRGIGEGYEDAYPMSVLQAGMVF